MHSHLQFKAWFKDPDPDAEAEDEISRRIVGWRESDGAAMVLEATTGRVVPAAEQDGFKFIEQLPDVQPLGVVPGNGWRITKTGQGPVREAAQYPVAFLVFDSHVVPVMRLPTLGDSEGLWKDGEWKLLAPEE